MRRPQHRQIIASDANNEQTPWAAPTAQPRPANPGWPRSGGCSNRTSRPKPRCLPPGPRLHLDKIPRQIMASVALEPRPRQDGAAQCAAKRAGPLLVPVIHHVPNTLAGTAPKACGWCEGKSASRRVVQRLVPIQR